MSYAGNCDDDNQDDNLTEQAEPYFHTVSLLQISHYLATVEGIKTIATGNSIPTIEAYGNYVIPVETPFYLQADVKNVHEDNVTYTFEQLDRGSQTYLSARDNGASPLLGRCGPMPPTTGNSAAWNDRSELLPAILPQQQLSGDCPSSL